MNIHLFILPSIILVVFVKIIDYIDIIHIIIWPISSIFSYYNIYGVLSYCVDIDLYHVGIILVIV